MGRVNALPALWFSGRLQSASGEELTPSLSFGDAPQSALMPSILDKALRESYDNHVIARSVRRDVAIPRFKRRLLRWVSICVSFSLDTTRPAARNTCTWRKRRCDMWVNVNALREWWLSSPECSSLAPPGQV